MKVGCDMDNNEKIYDTKKIEFMDCEELIQLMISKGIVIEDELKAIESISNYSYYSIINTYKHVFKKSDKSYKEGTSFSEIYSLYKFDKSLKAIFLKYLLEIESIIKTQISIVFSRKYGIKDYLVEENFQLGNVENITKRKIQINKLIDEVKQEIELSNGKHDAITHYINNYLLCKVY